jgi:hypothetical protein
MCIAMHRGLSETLINYAYFALFVFRAAAWVGLGWKKATLHSRDAIMFCSEKICK